MLAACLLAWARNEEGDEIDAQVAALLIADTIIKYRASITTTKKTKR